MDKPIRKRDDLMTLELALAENTAALNRVAELLTISNADRAKLLAGGSTNVGSGTASTASSGDTEMSVADIKTAAHQADKATLEQMLADETGGKNRATAVKAIEAALAKLTEGKSDGPSAGASETPAETPNPAAATPSGQGASPSDKNAQPVPGEISADQAKAAFGGWFGETDDEGERGNRRSFVEEMVGALGAKVGDLDLTGRRKAIFFLRRKRAGLSVDFAAAYDFDGSPTQELKVAAAAQPEDDLL
jgi:hypothetical protein